jgi:hypothetical protein
MSFDSTCSEGCPAADSFYYEQRSILYETRRAQKGRRALTAYAHKKSKDTIGAGECHILGKNIEVTRATFHRSQTFRNRRVRQNPEMIFTSM